MINLILFHCFYLLLTLLLIPKGVQHMHEFSLNQDANTN